VPQAHQPPNPEDEDDVVPDQHAAFGITQATQRRRESEWRDLGLDELVGRAGLPGVEGSATGANREGIAGASNGNRIWSASLHANGIQGNAVGSGSGMTRLVLRSRRGGAGSGFPR
jgi:hypothetical protein